jgi:uncharacterized protein (DUF1684 family)
MVFGFNFEKLSMFMILRYTISLILSILTFSGFAQSIHEFRKDYKEKTLKQFPNSEQDFYSPNEKFDLQATYKFKKKGKVIAVPTSGTKIKEYREYAQVKFKVDGVSYKFMVYQPVPVLPMYKDHLFLPIKDLTSPLETYGGGRYMDLKISDFKNGLVKIDFNKLYNPYCAFSDGWNCPIPPKGNHLSLRIEAGEKNPLKTEYDKD